MTNRDRDEKARIMYVFEIRVKSENEAAIMHYSNLLSETAMRISPLKVSIGIRRYEGEEV